MTTTRLLPLRAILLSFTLLLAAPLAVLFEAVAQELPELRIEEHGTDADARRAFKTLDPARIPTGLLHDQVAGLVDLARFDGRPRAEAASLDDWRQAYFELARSGVPGAEKAVPFPSADAIARAAERYLDQGLTPIAVLDVAYNRIRPDALERGLLRMQNGRLYDAGHRARTPYETQTAFVAAVYKAKSHGRSVRFVVPPELYAAPEPPGRAAQLEVDLGDGRGWRPIRLGEAVTTTYATGGTKEIRLALRENGRTRYAAATHEVDDIEIPEPDRVWLDQEAEIGYAGGAARYDAYAFYGRNRSRLVRPVVFVEGFDVYADDPARRRTWQDIYELLAEEGFAETLLAARRGIVILKLHDAADYVQRNAFALVDLLATLDAELPRRGDVVVVGPSMGGLIGRYALAYMEQNGLPHRVSKYVSVDAPHQGANLPLGDQFLFEFFDNDSDKAREGKDAVNSVAGRQMLVYQYRAVPEEDPLRTELRTELDALGYPSATENHALASGSGFALAQLGNERSGFRRMAPGDKIVEYRYRSFFVDLDGDVWAVPDEDDPPTQIFEGRKDVIGPHRRVLNVYVSGSQPYDNAPGGARGTQGEIVAGDPPRGRMYTSFPDHDWIPTTSALDLPTPDLFYNVEADPDDLVAETPGGGQATALYASIHYPEDNEAHVDPNPENVRALLRAIDPALDAEAPALPMPMLAAEAEAASALPAHYALEAGFPNPFNATTEIRFALPEAGAARLDVYDVLGRRVARLVDGPMPAGRHRVTWNAEGRASGLYLYRLAADGFTETRQVLLVR